ncbi:hypothetical protein A11A3_13410 [Alcanivorax hongdengensis A-11-3]|uniref:Phosphate transport regulator n=1 Tax=Alcanivorax hongdengensis A-11-3 TaxID=1177179 RepID=L0W9W2_9GAMM|nr:DUF47 family protein [Alcanivorax hongdengensis]EKF73538.1 hypothetical protein A11A3_13410 [Alcanivorax hongdengensis A-11-3]
MIMGFIRKFVMPREMDLAAALQEQTSATRKLVHDLHAAYILHDEKAANLIKSDAGETRQIKDKNMKELLDVFIAPYDKESIFRIITQLDWIALSVKHFVVEMDAYHNRVELGEYQDLFELLVEMATLLENGFRQLSGKMLPVIAPIHDKYDLLVERRAQHMARLLDRDDVRLIMIHRDVLSQLKEIAKRMQVTANTLEDMAIKVM